MRASEQDRWPARCKASCGKCLTPKPVLTEEHEPIRRPLRPATRAEVLRCGARMGWGCPEKQRLGLSSLTLTTPRVRAGLDKGWKSARGLRMGNTRGRSWSIRLSGCICGETFLEGDTPSAHPMYWSTGMNTSSIDKSLKSTKRRRRLEALPGQATKTLRCLCPLRNHCWPHQWKEATA